MLEHPNAKTCWPTVRWDSKTLEHVYIVETDLALAPDDQNFDEEAFNSLTQAVKDYLEEHPTYDRIEVSQIVRPENA